MHRMRLILTAALAFAVFVLPSVACADGVNWTIEGVTFADGGTVSGSFSYNANNNTYSNIDVTSTAGTLLTGSNYTTLTNGYVSGPTLLGMGPNIGSPANFTGDYFLQLMFTDLLTNAGGTVTLTAVETYCGNSTCSSPIVRRGDDGSITSAIATPEPTALVLLAAGLLGLLLLRKP
jgi:hypothetical protein